jgi:DNA helicase-2/ATP-dependent DNA helicase PcrA
MDPGSILCLSFTNRAAREMRERLAAVLGKAASEVSVRTFHGLCAHILRHEFHPLGIPPDFTICDEEDARALLAEACNNQGIVLRAADKIAAQLFSFVEKVKESPGAVGDAAVISAMFETLCSECEEAPANLAGCDPVELLACYNQSLREYNQLDFPDLIACVVRLFREHPATLDRWQHLYRWIQVDEIQDTNEAEYDIIAQLAAIHKELAFFGDIDQTIYEWRGSVPFHVLGRFKCQFAPVTERVLVQNYRSTRTILRACEAFIKAGAGTVTQVIEAVGQEKGDPILLRSEDTVRDEAKWICGRIRNLVNKHGVAPSRIAVLTRTNILGAEISRVMTEEKINHFVIDNFRFFRRAEVKDAMAHVRFLLNPTDGHSLIRLLQRPPKGIGEATLKALRDVPEEVGLRLVDLVNPVALACLDPFGPLLEGLAKEQVVVFDVETTGLETSRDEIVELAAARVGPKGATARFHRYVKPARPLGDSVSIHGLTEDFLAKHGEAPQTVLADFSSFCRGCLLVGHNVGFDRAIVQSQLRRLKMPCPPLLCYDTLEMTRRFFRLQRFTLLNICRELKLLPLPTHHALEDVEATAQLLGVLVERLRSSTAERRHLLARYGGLFAPLAASLQQWRDWLESERPIFLLNRILKESGLEEFTVRQPNGQQRVAHLQELAYLFGRYDDPGLPPDESLRAIAGIVSLGAEADRYLETEEKVFVLTVHQAKGLEFDAVFIAGATDNEFPSWRSQREGRLEEEHRLFYVAMTRARQRLFVSHHRSDGRGRKQKSSRYLDFIPGDLCRWL